MKQLLVVVNALLAVVLGIGYVQTRHLSAAMDSYTAEQSAIINELDRLSAWFDNYTNQLRHSSEDAATRFEAEIDTYGDSKLASATSAINQMTYEALEAFRVEVAAVEAELTQAKRVREDARREIEGRPPFVSFEDAFAANYALATRARSTSTLAQFQPVAVTFETSAGDIAFRAADFSFGRVPSTGEPAWFRIGMEDARLSSELVQAFISQAASLKRSEGYRNLSERTFDADYGEVTETVLRNGDLYFRTWFQYERILETYGRHSLQYTFFVETGSESRRGRAQAEGYTRVLGN